MKQIFVLIALFVYAIASTQEYTVLHINSSWNYKNDYKHLNKLKGAKIVTALLEEQKASIKNQIKSVPVIFIYRDRNLVGRWDGGISLSIDVPVSELQEVINSSRFRRVSTN
jgi:hypothetical protein|tara:strand:+ start:1133 stop:1468 length:336 start_codon:yes stop_codon:yes gene_type:complete